MMKIAIYPGTFDPVTNGHLDLVSRASALFDQVIVAVSNNRSKQPLFSLEERFELIRSSVNKLQNVSTEIFTGLLVDYAVEKNACAVIRGLRAVSDFEYEFQMALMNRNMNPNIETVFLMPSADLIFINSSIVKEIASLNGNINNLVPEPVALALHQKYMQTNK